VFGKCYNGMELLKDIEEDGSEDGKPKAVYKIENCG